MAAVAAGWLEIQGWVDDPGRTESADYFSPATGLIGLPHVDPIG